MNSIYLKIWQLAQPYYEKGGRGDIETIPWIMQKCEELCFSENVDKSILMPFVILHDVGYALCPRENSARIEMKLMHMRYGKEIAKKILNEIHYDKEKIKQICEYIGMHDDWAFGRYEMFKKDHILGLFSDLRFLCICGEIGFEKSRLRRGISYEDMLDLIEYNEKTLNRPFVCSFTRNLFRQLLFERKNKTNDFW